MIKLTRLYPDFYYNDKTEPLYIDENAIISISTTQVKRVGYVHYSINTEITLITGDKYIVKEQIDQVYKKIEKRKEVSNEEDNV